MISGAERLFDIRVLWWNTSRKHAGAIDRQIDAILELEEAPDIIALSEVDASRAKRWRQRLGRADYRFVRSAPGLRTKELRVILASRLPMMALARRRFAGCWPRSLSSARVRAGGAEVDIHAVQIPNGSKYQWAKIDHLRALRRALELPHPRPQVLVGGFNTPQSESDGRIITWGQWPCGELAYDWRPKRPYPKDRPWDAELWDQGERAVLERLPEECDMPDTFRSLHPQAVAEGTWIPEYRGRPLPEERGRRFDRIYASARLKAITCRHIHDWRREGLSDHLALEAVFRVP